MRLLEMHHARASFQRATRLTTVAGALALAGCATTSGEAPPASASSARMLHIGKSATVIGIRAGEKLDVTLLAFTRSVPGSANNHPEFEWQYVGARITLRNVSTVDYSGVPVDSLMVISTEAQKSKTTVLTEGACSDQFAKEVKLAPGESAQGCVAAQVLVASTPAYVRFAPYRSSPNHAAEWTLASVR